MIDYARPYEPVQNMCDLYLTNAPPAPARLDDFQVFRKGTPSYIYGNYYANSNYDAPMEPEMESAIVYHNLVSSRECHRDDFRNKMVVDWNQEDTLAWVIDTTQYMGYFEYEIPYYNFRLTGMEFRQMPKEEILRLVAHPNIDPGLSRRIGDYIYSNLQDRLNQDISKQTVLRYTSSEMDPYAHPTVCDMDALDYKNYTEYRAEGAFRCNDSGDDAEEKRLSQPASPSSYGSDGSKSGDEENTRKKRPPGRPKGSGRKTCKRPRSVSVPEFLRNLLLDPKFCPSIIKWESHADGKFRFVKPDEVAKLWGRLKQNDNMTFEKFSRAMRYHYRQEVLVSVPTARLVYQFGKKGPDYQTDNPNFVKVKCEVDSYDIYS